MTSKIVYDQRLDTANFVVEVSTTRLYGYFEHKRLGDNCGGGLWFEHWNALDVLTDHDGTASLPREVADALVAAGYCVTAEYFDAPPPGTPGNAELWEGLHAGGPFFTVSKREARLGGGYNLRFYQHGMEQGAGVFPAAGDNPELLVAALADALNAGAGWRDTRTTPEAAQ